MKIENPKNLQTLLSIFFLFLKEPLKNDNFLIWEKAKK